MALKRLEILKLAGASMLTRRTATDVDGRQAAAVSEAWSAGATEAHRVPLSDSATRATIHARRGDAWVTKLAHTPNISIPAPKKIQMVESV